MTSVISVKVAMDAIPTTPLANPYQLQPNLSSLKSVPASSMLTEVVYPNKVRKRPAKARFSMSGVRVSLRSEGWQRTSIVSTLPRKPNERMTNMTVRYATYLASCKLNEESVV